MRLGDFRAHGKVCICVGVWTLTGVYPLVGMVCVRINPGAGCGVEDGIGVKARFGVGFQLVTMAVDGEGRP